jgi:phenylacetate-CoA ligase
MQQELAQRALAALQKFYTTSLDDILAGDGIDDDDIVLPLFQRVARQVPAYRDFLNERHIDADQVQSLEAFEQLPMITKENYLRRHVLADLCWRGRLENCDIMAVSSGSTGAPTFWPRFVTDEVTVAARFEQIFHDSFEADHKSTLAVICFALGTWVGGIYTMNCCRHLASKGYPITVVAPGNNKEEIFRVVTELGAAFDQVVLLGYPPFLKDVIDSGRAHDVPWNQYSIKLVMAGEVFSEEWRDLMGERAGMNEPPFDSASLYGTADAGVLGNETPLSITIRRFLARTPEAARQLFGESRLPTLVQYDPVNRYFETTPEGTLLFTGDNGIPLIRYHIADNGGLMNYDAMLEFLRAWNFDPLNELAGRRGVRPLPFVWVFGRSHFTVSYYGANIYPENITVGLEQSGIREWVTGKFVLEAVEDESQDRILRIVVELAPGEIANQQRHESAAISIETHLKRLNSEFANYVPKGRHRPQVEFRAISDAEYFPPGVKHRYTRQKF